MTNQSRPYIQMVNECEAAIVRIRTAMRTGNDASDEVGEDFEFIVPTR